MQNLQYSLEKSFLATVTVTTGNLTVTSQVLDVTSPQKKKGTNERTTNGPAHNLYVQSFVYVPTVRRRQQTDEFVGFFGGLGWGLLLTSKDCSPCLFKKTYSTKRQKVVERK